MLKRRHILIITLCVLVFIVFGVVFYADFWSRDNNDDGAAQNNLQKGFNSQGCENPCWLGIEVGKTDEETAIDIIEAQEIDYSSVQIPSDEQVINGLNLYLDGFSPLWANADKQTGALYTIDGVVIRIDLPANVCVTSIVADFDFPLVASTGGSSYVLLYPEQGIEFWVDSTSKRSSNAVLRTKEDSKGMVRVP